MTIPSPNQRLGDIWGGGGTRPIRGTRDPMTALEPLRELYAFPGTIPTIFRCLHMYESTQRPQRGGVESSQLAQHLGSGSSFRPQTPVMDDDLVSAVAGEEQVTGELGQSAVRPQDARCPLGKMPARHSASTPGGRVKCNGTVQPVSYCRRLCC